MPNPATRHLNFWKERIEKRLSGQDVRDKVFKRIREELESELEGEHVSQLSGQDITAIMIKVFKWSDQELGTSLMEINL